jgi:hypothetical protein
MKDKDRGEREEFGNVSLRYSFGIVRKANGLLSTDNYFK